MRVLILFLSLSTCLNFGYAQETVFGNRDNPVRIPARPQPVDSTEVPTLGPMDNSSAFSQNMEATLGECVLQSDSVKAYLLQEWSYDTTGFMGYRIEQIESNVADGAVNELIDILSQKHSYDLGEANKRCDFSPRMAFTFSKGQEQRHILIATNCDILKIVNQAGGVTFMEDCDPAHDRLVALCQSIFLNSNYSTTN